MTPTIFIIILNWNGKDNTIACLESINRLQSTDYSLQTVVVDNGSEEEFNPPVFDLLESERPRSRRPEAQNRRAGGSKFKLVRNEENLGFSGGNNVGIKFALEHDADFVLILNNDTLVDKNLVGELLNVVNRDSQIGIVAPKIYFAKGFEFHKDRYKERERGKVIWYAGGIMDWNNVIGHHRGVDEVDRGQYDKPEETDFASGCAMLVKREVFEKAGLLDEKYFLYYEDSDFCERTKRHSYKIMYTPKAFLWHKNAGSAGGSGSALQDYYITRNRMLFAMRYAPLRSKLAIMKESLLLLVNGRKWQRQGAMDFYLGKFGKGSYIL